MQAENADTFGIAWYEREEYPQVLAAMEDASIFPVDYDTWRRRVDAVARIEQARGSVVIKAPIYPAPFAAWCLATGLHVDVHARARYLNLAIDDYCAGGKKFGTSVIPIRARVMVPGPTHAGTLLGSPEPEGAVGA